MKTYLDIYLETLRDRGDGVIADSVLKTSSEFALKYLDTFSFAEHEVGLLFGNVQAGKTGQMFGILCAAADRSFPIFIVLTTDNVTLQKQTYERLVNDLRLCDFCICDESDIQKFINNALIKPAIVVLKKNSKVLLQWNNALQSSSFVRGNALFIIDDEADAASLNTLVNSNKVSSINQRIRSIRDASIGSIYLQVTGTPQAILLQTHISGFRPAFTSFFEPGKGYLGGNFFFGDNKKPIKFIGAKTAEGEDDTSDDMMDAFMHHIICSAILKYNNKCVCNFVIHPGVKKSSHNASQKHIKNIIELCKANLDNENFSKWISDRFDSITPECYEKPDFNDLLGICKSMISNEEIKIIMMNGDNAISDDEYKQGYNVIIGGNILGRGVTFPKLHTIYYTRTAKKPQADTMWQHSRMFGYDRDPGLIAVFITDHLYKLFMDINDGNNSMIRQIERGLDKVQIIYPEGLNPTRKNVIDQRNLSLIVGGTNYYADDPRNDSVDELNILLKPFENEPYCQVGLVLISQILNHIIPSDDFDMSGFKGAIKAQIASNPGSQGILIVRKGREVTQGTGSLLSPNDRQIGDQFSNMTVLTMYQIIGEHGWKQSNLWVPNIKLPENVNYYNI